MARREIHRRTVRWRMLVRGLALAAAALLALVAVHAIHRRFQESKRVAAARDWLLQAEEGESREDWLAAANAIEGYLNLQPGAEDQRVRLARLYAKGSQDAEQRDRAIDFLYRAIGVCRDEERADLQAQIAEMLLAAERVSEAQACASQLVKSDPTNPIGLKVRALALFRQYQRGELDFTRIRSLPIVDWLDAARRANPTNVELAELTAAAYRDLRLAGPEHLDVAGRERMADLCLEQLVAAAPNRAEVYLARYRYRLQQGDKDASDDLKRASEHGSDHPAVLEAAAAAELAKREFAVAAALYRRVIDLRPQSVSAEVYLAWGDSLLAAGNRDEAIHAWRAGMEAHPQALALFQGKLADLYLETQQWEAAAKLIERIEEHLSGQTTSDSEVLAMERDQSLRRGILLFHCGNAQEAVPHFERVVSLQEQIGSGSHQLAFAWKHLGQIHAQLGDWESAARAFDFACHEEPQVAALWLLSGEAHARLDSGDAAAKRALQALRKGLSAPSDRALAQSIVAQHTRSVGPRPWPGIADLHEHMETSAQASTAPFAHLDRKLPFEAALILSQSHLQRGEFESAEQLLWGAAHDESPALRAVAQRELALQALTRRDVEQAHTMMSTFLRETPYNGPLLELAAQVEIDNDHRIRDQKAQVVLP